MMIVKYLIGNGTTVAESVQTKEKVKSITPIEDSKRLVLEYQGENKLLTTVIESVRLLSITVVEEKE